jgi:flagellar biosynthesis protein FlhG
LGGFHNISTKGTNGGPEAKGRVAPPGNGVPGSSPLVSMPSSAGEVIAASPSSCTTARSVPSAVETVVRRRPIQKTDNKTVPEFAKRRIVAVGGGKGGIGKSLITSSLGISLARRGFRVVVIDADLGGANLHNAVGISTPNVTLADFIHHRVDNMNEVIIDTGIPNLGLISGAHDFLTAANLKYFQKTRLLNRIRKLEADFVLLDIGAGISFNIVDFFLLSEVGLLVAVPEPSSIEGAYRFLKMSFYRHLWAGLKGAGTARRVIEQAMDQKNQKGIRTPYDLLEAVVRDDEEAGQLLKEQAQKFRPRLLVNQVRFPEDRHLGNSMANVCRKHLGVDIDCLGAVTYDDGVWKANRKKTPFMLTNPDSETARSIDGAATRLLSLFQN